MFQLSAVPRNRLWEGSGRSNKTLLWIYSEIFHTHENHSSICFFSSEISFVLFPSEISMHQVTTSIRENWPSSHLAEGLPKHKGIYYSYKQWGIWLTFPKAIAGRKVNDHPLKWKQEVWAGIGFIIKKTQNTENVENWHLRDPGLWFSEDSATPKALKGQCQQMGKCLSSAFPTSAPKVKWRQPSRNTKVLYLRGAQGLTQNPAEISVWMEWSL